jgi:hypothetical protein
MKKLFYLLLLPVLFSCKQKNPSQSDYMHRALLSDHYKIILVYLQRVKDSLDLMKKHPIDTTVVIYEFNLIGGKSTQVNTMSQVEIAMKKDTEFLKSVQMNIATQMAKDHQDSISKAKP